jgi:hypothetical protein
MRRRRAQPDGPAQSSRWREAILLASIFAVLLALQLQLPRWCCMGDEARYLLYSASFHRDHTFSMPREEWTAVLARAGCQFVDVGTFLQSVGYAVVFSPVVGRFGLEGARWFNFAVSLVGFTGIYVLLRRRHGVAVSALAMAAAAFTIPGFAYHKSIFTEIPSMTLIAWAWYLIDGGTGAAWRRALIVALLALLPIVHIRTIPLACTLMGIVLWDVWSGDQALRVRQLAETLAMGAALAAVVIALERHLYGAVTGSASAAHPLAFDQVLPLIALHLFDLRHGLLVYTPIWVFAIAGFVLGCWRRQRGMAVGAAMLAVSTLSLIWSIAAESMPARYWVSTLPILAVGLAAFVAERKHWMAWSAFVPLLLVSALNSLMFLKASGVYLENRTMSLSYHTLFQRFPYFHLGAFLPWDGIDYGAPHMEQSFPRAVWLSVAAIAVVLLTVWACRSRKRLVAVASSMAALAVVLGVVGASGVSSIAVEDYRVIRSTDPKLAYEAGSVRVQKDQGAGAASPAWMTILFLTPARPGLVVLARAWDLWYAPNYPVEFRLEVSEDGTHFTRLADVTARGALPIPLPRRVAALRITENPRTAKSRWLRPEAPSAYRRDPHFALLALLGALSIGAAFLAGRLRLR